MNIKFLLLSVMAAFMLNACKNEPAEEAKEGSTAFEYKVDQFADLQILRYQIPGWDELNLKEQTFVYYLTQAGLEGRDIMWDQNYRHNLKIRKALENIYSNFDGDKSTEDWKNFETYLKRVWFSNGIHHHYSNDKLPTVFSQDYFEELLTATNTILDIEAKEVMFNDKDMKKVDRTKGADNILTSAVNFYGPDVTDADLENFYKDANKDRKDQPIEAGLNSK